MFFFRRWPSGCLARLLRFAKRMKYAVWVSGQQVMLFQRQSNTPPELAHRRILLRWQRFEYHWKDNLRAFYRVHAQNLRITDE